MFCPFRNDNCMGRDCIFEDNELKACRLKIIIDKGFEIAKDMVKNKGEASPLSAFAGVMNLILKRK